jgi:hypothetical protein
MSSVLYYSNYCQNSKELLQILSKTKLKEDIHYFCIDNRVRKPNGMTYIVLSNNQEIILPPNVTKVPSLMLINKNHQVVTGKENILSHLRPQEQVINQTATNFNGEPMAFSFNGAGFGVVSDNYSFLDQSADALQAKGDGGLRQMHHYATLEYTDKINTPEDKYQPDKIGQVSVEKLQQNRNSQLQHK